MDTPPCFPRGHGWSPLPLAREKTWRVYPAAATASRFFLFFGTAGQCVAFFFRPGQKTKVPSEFSRGQVPPSPSAPSSFPEHAQRGGMGTYPLFFLVEKGSRRNTTSRRLEGPPPSPFSLWPSRNDRTTYGRHEEGNIRDDAAETGPALLFPHARNGGG